MNLMMIPIVKLLICLFLSSNNMYGTASSEAVMASTSDEVKKVFTQAAQQFVKLKAEKGGSPQELYKPYAQAAASIVDIIIANNNPHERNELLSSLINALKLSFWYPEIWISSSKQPDKKYEAIMTKPTLNDGADRLVGEVFTHYPFTAQGMTQATEYLVTNTLFTARSNPALQGAIITGL